MEGEEEMSMPLWRMLVEKDWDLLQSIEPRNMAERGKKMLKDDLVERGSALVAITRAGKTSRWLASEIASFLRCGELHFDDIQKTLLQLVTDPEVAAASPHNRLDDLSYRALLRFASTQLLLGHDAVVDIPLISHPTAFGELLDLADSNGVPLIVVECIDALDESSTPQGGKVILAQNSERRYSSSASRLDTRLLLKGSHQSFDHDASDVPRLVIDTEQDRHSAADDLEEVIIQFILLHKQNVGSDCKGDDTACSSYDGEKLKRHFSHSHPLAFVPAGRDNDIDSPSAASPDWRLCLLLHITGLSYNCPPYCRICLLPVTGSSYNCPRCDFVAHQACIELPQYARLSPHNHPLGLCVLSYSSITFNYKGTINCIVCNGAKVGPMYRCWQCYGFYIHHECAQLSKELKHPCHEHPLELETYDLFSSRNQYICRACGHRGGNISYGCSACELKLHPACALEVPVEVEYKCAQWHPLVLAPNPKDNKYDEYFCDVCEEPRHRDYWIYYCGSCEFHAHLNCVNPEIPAYNMAEDSVDDGDNAWQGSPSREEDWKKDITMLSTTMMMVMNMRWLISTVATMMILKGARKNRHKNSGEISWDPLGLRLPSD